MNDRDKCFEGCRDYVALLRTLPLVHIDPDMELEPCEGWCWDRHPMTLWERLCHWVLK